MNEHNQRSRDLISRFRKAAFEVGAGDTSAESLAELAAAQTELYAALAQPVAAEGWTRVDERMPESQSPILLDIGGKHPIRAMWVEAKSLPVGVESDDDFGEYDEDSDEWYCPAGWYEWNQHEECHWRVGADPAHWRPLPPPPTPA